MEHRGYSSVEVIAEEMYQDERGTTTYPSNPTEWNVDTTKDPSTGSPRADLFKGIGLIYASDYGYAVGAGSERRSKCFGTVLSDYNLNNCASNNYLYRSSVHFWTLSHFTGTSFGHEVSLHVSYVTQTSTGIGREVRPTVYLRKTVTLGKGNGTSDSPYHLEA